MPLAGYYTPELILVFFREASNWAELLMKGCFFPPPCSARWNRAESSINFNERLSNFILKEICLYTCRTFHLQACIIGLQGQKETNDELNNTL